MSARRRSGRWWLGVLALGLVVLVGFPPATADLLQDLGATYQQVAEELARAFPKFEGRITAAEEDDAIELTGAGIGQLRPGLELTVYRKGERFRHPITNQPLGQSEIEVATLSVVAVSGDAARGRVVWTASGQSVADGDGVRLTAGRLPVAVLPTEGVQAPFESADQTAVLLATRFAAILEKTGRFLAVEPQRVLGLVARPEGESLSPLEVARRLNATAVLSSRVVLEARTRFLEVTWWSGRSGAQMASLRQPLQRATFPPRFVWEQTPELERRLVLDGSARALALADLDGDGRAELVVADEDVVTLYRWQDGTGLVPLAGGTLRPGGAVLAADAADLTGAGRAQLVVTDIGGTSRDSVRARVFAWEDGQFRPLYETRRRFLRVVPVGSEPWLMEQDADDPEPFTGTIRRLVWREGRFEDGPDVRVPRGVSVYGLALMRLTGSPEPEVVAVTGEDRLVVWTAKGQRLWTSSEPMGGATVTFPYFLEGRNEGARDATLGRVPPRVVSLPGAAGGPEVLVYENLLPGLDVARTLLPRLAPVAFNAGRVHRLRWKDGGFLKVWQSTATGGYIADLTYGDLDGDTIPEVLVAVVPRGFNLDALNPFGRSRAQLVFYELP